MDGQFQAGANKQREPAEPSVQAGRHCPATAGEEGGDGYQNLRTRRTVSAVCLLYKIYMAGRKRRWEVWPPQAW